MYLPQQKGQVLGWINDLHSVTTETGLKHLPAKHKNVQPKDHGDIRIHLDRQKAP